jgi:hypothetical protein
MLAMVSLGPNQPARSNDDRAAMSFIIEPDTDMRRGPDCRRASSVPAAETRGLVQRLPIGRTKQLLVPNTQVVLSDGEARVAQQSTD